MIRRRFVIASVSAIALVAATLLVPSTAAFAQKNFSRPPNMGNSQGGNSQGDNSQGDNSQGDNSQGNGSQGNGSQGNSSTDDRNPRFTLINDSDQIIDNLNISPVSENSWGDDLLGTLALPPHNRLIAGPTQDHGCMFDVRVVYHDRREEVLRGQNLCKLDELSFTGRHARAQREHSQSDD